MKPLLSATLLCMLFPLTGCLGEIPTSNTPTKAEAALNGKPLRPGVEFTLLAADRDGRGPRINWEGESVSLQEKPLLIAADVERVEGTLNRHGMPVLQFVVRKESRKKVEDTTTAWEGQRMVLIVDGEPVAVNRLYKPITYNAEIIRIGSLEEVKALEKRITVASP